MLLFKIILLFFSALSCSICLGFEQGKELASSSLKEKSTWIEKIAADPATSSAQILEAWLMGKLFYWPQENRLVVAQKDGRSYLLLDLETGDALETVTRKQVKKIKVNNKLRKQIKQTIAFLDLSSSNISKRSAAIAELKRKPDYSILQTLLKLETSNQTENLASDLNNLIGLVLLRSNYESEQMDGLNRLAGDLSASTKEALSRFDRRQDLSDAARTTVTERIEELNRKLKYWKYAQNVVFGLSLGSVLLLAAVGLAITFGVMGVINMAHGEFIMLGAYTTFVIQQLLPGSGAFSLWISIPTAFLVAGAAGVLLERTVIQHLYGRPLETLLATVGVSLILQQTVRSIFGPLNQSVATPELLSGSLVINAAFAMTYNRIFVIIFAGLVIVGLWVLMYRTSFGIRIRAVTMNRGMASSMGVRTKRMDALAFGLGSGVAGMAGVAISQLTNVGPNLGQAYIIDSFMVVVFGGVGNLFGTVIAALTLGVANKLVEPLSGAVLAKIIILIFIIVFIQRRPRGLFATKGRSAEG